MRKYKYILFIVIIALFYSCGSIKSTIKNIDDSVTKPLIKENSFVITEYATDNKYGFDKDYPINIGFNNEKEAPKNISYYFNALAGKNGEKLTYTKIESCCPFPTKRTAIGAGTLDIYEIRFEGNDKKEILYINIYEKGKILCPKGFTIKNKNLATE